MGTQRFVLENISSEGLNHLRYSDLIPVNTRHVFAETSPQTFVRSGVINSYCFRRERCAVQLGNLADRILFPKIFCGLNFQLKLPSRSTCISLHKHTFTKLYNNLRKQKNGISKCFAKIFLLGAPPPPPPHPGAPGVLTQLNKEAPLLGVYMSTI